MGDDNIGWQILQEDTFGNQHEMPDRIDLGQCLEPVRHIRDGGGIARKQNRRCEKQKDADDGLLLC